MPVDRQRSRIPRLQLCLARGRGQHQQHSVHFDQREICRHPHRRHSHRWCACSTTGCNGNDSELQYCLALNAATDT